MNEKPVPLKEAVRLIAIVDVSLQETVLNEFLHRGARGYNCVSCFGKGSHEPMEDPFSGKSLVRIEVITNAETANSLMSFLHSPRFKNYAVTVFHNTVNIAASEHFADPA